MVDYLIESFTNFSMSSKYKINQENYNPDNSCINSASNYLTNTLEYISGPVTAYTLVNNKTGVKIFMFGDHHNRINMFYGNQLTNDENTIYLADLLYLLPQINNHINYEYFFELHPSDSLNPDDILQRSNAILLDNCNKIIKKLLYSDTYYDKLKINFIDIREAEYDFSNNDFDKLILYQDKLVNKLLTKCTNFDFKDQKYLDLFVKYMLFDNSHEISKKIYDIISTKYDISDIKIDLDIIVEILKNDLSLDFDKIKVDLYNFCFGDSDITRDIIHYYIIYFAICMDFICINKIIKVPDNTNVFIVAGNKHISNYISILSNLDYSVKYEQIDIGSRCPGFDPDIYPDSRSRL